MLIVERTNENGSTTLFGPIRRRKTAEKVVDLFDSTGERSHIRELTPWRRGLLK